MISRAWKKEAFLLNRVNAYCFDSLTYSWFAINTLRYGYWVFIEHYDISAIEYTVKYVWEKRSTRIRDTKRVGVDVNLFLSSELCKLLLQSAVSRSTGSQVYNKVNGGSVIAQAWTANYDLIGSWWCFNTIHFNTNRFKIIQCVNINTRVCVSHSVVKNIDLSAPLSSCSFCRWNLVPIFCHANSLY